LRAWSSFIRSFSYAFAGIAHTVKTQRNMRIHVAAAIVALVMAWWLEISRNDVLLVFFSIALVFSLELMNTAIEATVDLASPERHEKAKAAKDAAAGSVLVAAVLSVIVGLYVFGPPILQKLSAWLPA
jgi:diacylglycerol kinase